MVATKLLYLTDMTMSEAFSRVVNVVSEQDGEVMVEVEATPFYPQGGGQPSDAGIIESETGLMTVGRATIKEGIVWHVGKLVHGAFTPGQPARLRIDSDRRWHHSRLHSAGELVCAAVRSLGLNWLVSSAMHFPGSARIVYDIVLSEDQREFLKTELPMAIHRLLGQGGPITIETTEDRQKVQDLCGYDPHYIPLGEPVRIVMMCSPYARPCMGSHVNSVHNIGAVEVRNIRSKKGQTSLGYELASSVGETAR
jgi:Ser-tRNA(Ala) deacylase AlaX